MKFVHIADMHFDTSFTQLSNSENLGNLRRLEQKKVFKKVIEYIKNNAYIEELFLDFINEFKEQYDLLKNKEKKELLKIQLKERKNMIEHFRLMLVKQVNVKNFEKKKINMKNLIFVGLLKKISIVFFIVSLIKDIPIKHKLFPFFKVLIFLNVQSMFNGFHVLPDK